ncbi:MAG: Wadjet anti-phage system protein JetD domain-containing protein [Candidatus Azotimanducaceae bacterium WSBS_2022_MAG_OTU7]
MVKSTSWGLLPDAIIASLNKKEWQNAARFQSRLLGEQAFPIKVGVRPPSGNAALDDLNQFRKFVESWQQFSNQACVHWQQRNFRNLSVQEVPVHLLVPDMETLALILGPAATSRLAAIRQKIELVLFQPFVTSEEMKGALKECLIRHLELLECCERDDLARLANVVPQLRQGMGGGCYLRSLPIVGIDTKFIESNLRLLESIMDTLEDRAVMSSGGLLAWLDCREKPSGWLMVRALCEQGRSALGNLPLMQLSTETLLEHELPASRILVVENNQSGLALPPMSDTIAVFGGGWNVAWLAAGWLSKKQVGYWGDIDLEGLAILSDVRSKISHVVPLMMDEETVQTFQKMMVAAADSPRTIPAGLTEKEQALYRDLQSGVFGPPRLEQERIAVEFVRARPRREQ